MRSNRFLNLHAIGLMLILFVVISTSAVATATSKYADDFYWAYSESTADKATDVFFVCPTVYKGDDGKLNMSVDGEIRDVFKSAATKALGMFDQECNVFAPYYRQGSLLIYEQPEKIREPYLAIAYQDVKEAFQYYIQYKNNGRPFVLAGCSQGADMILRLLKDGMDDKTAKRMVVAYAIGWYITPDDVAKYPRLKMAQGETDTGVIICINTEAPEVKESIAVPKKTMGINPLNWRTDDVVANKSSNLGAVFINHNGKIIKELLNFTGAYLDKERGTIKVTDVDSDEYSLKSPLFGRGVYHVNDYFFFYRNIQENVKKRIAAFS